MTFLECTVHCHTNLCDGKNTPAEMAAAAAAKGIKVLLDLVPGHTSDQHPWFLEAKKAAKNEFSDRYIFTKTVCF